MEIKFINKEHERWYCKMLWYARSRGLTPEQVVCPFMLQEFADLHPKAMCAVVNTEPDIYGRLEDIPDLDNKSSQVEIHTVKPKYTWQKSKWSCFHQFGDFVKFFERQRNGAKFRFEQRQSKTLFYRVGGKRLPQFIIDCAKKHGGQLKKIDIFEYIVLDFEQMERFWEEATSEYFTI